jgi:hypothetical protein
VSESARLDVKRKEKRDFLFYDLWNFEMKFKRDLR